MIRDHVCSFVRVPDQVEQLGALLGAGVAGCVAVDFTVISQNQLLPAFDTPAIEKRRLGAGDVGNVVSESFPEDRGALDLRSHLEMREEIQSRQFPGYRGVCRRQDGGKQIDAAHRLIPLYRLEDPQYAPPWEFAFTVEALNKGLMRVGYETCFGRPEAQIWVSLWGVPEEEDAALRKRLVRALDGVFA